MQREAWLHLSTGNTSARLFINTKAMYDGHGYTEQDSPLSIELLIPILVEPLDVLIVLSRTEGGLWLGWQGQN